MTEPANDENNENAHKEPLWSDLVDLLPGFAKLTRLRDGHADSLFNRVRGIAYREAFLAQKDGRAIVHTKGDLPDAGFLEIKTHAGYILMSTPLKRAFLYPFDKGDAFLKVMMEPLLSAAGWVDALQRQNMEIRETLAPDQEPPYFTLATELEKDIRAAQEQAEATAGDFDLKPYFTDELHDYYSRRVDLHTDRGYEHAVRDEEAKRKWEAESSQACILIRTALDMLKSRGVHKIIFAKARPEAYEEAVKQIAEIRNSHMPSVPFAGDDMGFPLVFRRTQSKPEETEPQVSNIEKAKAFMKERWEGYLKAAREFQDKNGTNVANSHTQNLKRARNVVRDLDALMNSGVTEIGYAPDDSEDDVVAKIAAVKPSAAPEARDEQTGPIVVTPPAEADNESVVAPEITEREPSVAPTPTPSPAPAGPAPTISTAPAPQNVGPQTQPTASAPPFSAGTPRPIPPRAQPQPHQPPSVRDEWKYAKTIFALAKDKAPALLLGAATGAAVRIGAQFAMAAFVATTPGIAVVIGSAMVAGAAAGASSRLAVTAAFGGAKKQEQGWQRKALIEGALMGALGGALGASAMHFAHDYLQSWLGHPPASSTPPAPPNVPPPVSDSPAAGGPPVPGPTPPSGPVLPSADVPAPRATPSPPDVTVPADQTGSRVPNAPGALDVPSTQLRGSLTPDQFALLPDNVRHLARPIRESAAFGPD
ncbi:hypothetical protein [Bradyrhizobium sp. USDA 241]|uniref:hypothetical protein n=1 Tax=Bradyrhizobium sp. USDA 241 TaxID=3377725 RepID=UPI003C718288